MKILLGMIAGIYGLGCLTWNCFGTLHYLHGELMAFSVTAVLVLVGVGGIGLSMYEVGRLDRETTGERNAD